MKRGRKESSWVWKHFLLKEEKKKAECLICKSNLSYCNSTSSLINHLRKHGIFKYENSLNVKTEEEIQKIIMDPESIKMDIISLIIEDLQPINIINDSGFRKLLQKNHPGFIIPTRRTLKQKITEIYST